jgi:peptide/nickel transport system permease protein
MSYLWRRLIIAPILMLTSSFLTFWGLRLIGSNRDIVQGILGTNYTDDNAARLTKELGLNRPFFVQYITWLGRMLRGDMGTSFYSRQSVWSYLKTGIPTTFQLVLMSVLFALLLSMPLGILAAYRVGTKTDRSIGMLSFGLLSWICAWDFAYFSFRPPPQLVSRWAKYPFHRKPLEVDQTHDPPGIRACPRANRYVSTRFENRHGQQSARGLCHPGKI